MEFLILFLIGIAGILMHITSKFQDAVTGEPKEINIGDVTETRSTKDRFRIVWSKFDLLGNLVYSLRALLFIAFLVAIRDKLGDINPISEISIFFIGYAADSAFKNFAGRKVN